MESKIWDTSADGGIIYKQLTKLYLKDALNLVRKEFIVGESISIALDVSSDEQAINEIIELVELTVLDGISVVAVDKESNKVVGAVFNKIDFNNSEEIPYCDAIIKKWKNTKSKDFLQLSIDFCNNCNLFELCQTDCLMELTFLVVSSDYKKKGIGKQLFKTSLEIGALLKKGINVKIPIGDVDLTLEPTPKVAFSILTSPYSQKIAQSLQFEVPLRKKVEEFECGGKNLKVSVDENMKYIELVYKTL